MQVDLGNGTCREYADAIRDAGRSLETLFGTWGKPEHVLRDARSRQKHISAVDAPILERDDLERMITEESEYQIKAAEAIRMSQSAELDDLMITDSPNLSQLSNEEKQKLLRCLGIDPNADGSGLFSGLVAWNRVHKAQRQKLNSRLNKHSQEIDNLCVILLQLLGPSMCFGFKELDGRVAMQPRTRYYYRGENAIYPSSKASLCRISEPQERSIWMMRMDACLKNLDRVQAIRYPKLTHTDYVALAQHYGLKTCMLDITSDIGTALFFSCCDFVPGKDWEPLPPEAYAEPQSRPNVVDSRYALLFRSPTELNDLEFAVRPENSTSFGYIYPVGYQACARCAAQSAYTLLTEPGYDLQEDNRFEIYRVRLSEDLCNWAFQLKRGGRRIYAPEGPSDISDMVRPYCDLQTFSEDTALKYISGWAAMTPAEKNDYQKRNGIRITDSEPDVIDATMIDAMNREYTPSDAANRTVGELYIDVLSRFYSPALSFTQWW